MHAVQPAPEPLAAKLERLQTDALETVHWVMLHMVKSLTDPQDNDPAGHVTTQRARLCLQAARDLLRFRPPAEGDANFTRPWRKPGQATVREQTAESRTDAPAPAPDTQPAQARARASCRATASQPANTLLAAAGAEASRLGERIDSPHVPAPAHNETSEAHASPSSAPPSPSSVPSANSVSQPSAPSRDSSLVAHTSASPPPRPRYFNDAEVKEAIAVMNTPGRRFPPALYNQIIEWNRYAKTAGLSIAFGIKIEDLEARKPLDVS